MFELRQPGALVLDDPPSRYEYVESFDVSESRSAEKNGPSQVASPCAGWELVSWAALPHGTHYVVTVKLWRRPLPPERRVRREAEEGTL